MQSSRFRTQLRFRMGAQFGGCCYQALGFVDFHC
jgi:hypothetical protein